MKTLSNILLLLLIFALAACSSGDSNATGANSNTQQYTASFYDGDTLLFFITNESVTDILLYDTKERGFEGWHLGSDSGDMYRAGDPYTLAGDVKFYGKWSSIKVTTAQSLSDIKNGLEKSYRLRGDISLAGYGNWTPIGSETAPFKGVLYGNGYKISDLTVTSIAGSYAGLFGYINEASIYDISVVSADIDLSKSNGSDLYAGIIVGYADVDGSIIDNCSVSGRVSASQTASKDAYAGGVAGYYISRDIRKCASTADVEAFSNHGAYAGGIAGKSGIADISNSYAAGNVTSTHYAGGIVGYKRGGSILRSFHKNGTISANANADPHTVYAGGIAGYMEGGEIENSYTAGTVFANIVGNSSTSKVYAGGITGYVSMYATIDKSYSTAEVYAHSASTASGLVYAGGIAGTVEADGGISNSAASNSWIQITGNNAFIGRVSGKNETGAIISNNLAAEEMRTYLASAIISDLNGKDGGDILADHLMLPTTFTDNLYWDFGSSATAPWRIQGNQYPRLYWEPQDWI